MPCHCLKGLQCSHAGVLLVAGGIGITPMRVMFSECLRRGYPVSLLYTIRSAKDAAFLDEFQEEVSLTCSFTDLLYGCITATGSKTTIIPLLKKQPRLGLLMLDEHVCRPARGERR